MPRHSQIPPAQRVDLVLAALRGTEELEVLARRHQVSANTLRCWRDEFVAAGRDRLSGQGDAAAAALDNQRLTTQPAERELLIGKSRWPIASFKKSGRLTWCDGKREELKAAVQATQLPLRLTRVLDALGPSQVDRRAAAGRAAASAAGAAASTTGATVSRRGLPA